MVQYDNPMDEWMQEVRNPPDNLESFLSGGCIWVQPLHTSEPQNQHPNILSLLHTAAVKRRSRQREEKLELIVPWCSAQGDMT